MQHVAPVVCFSVASCMPAAPTCRVPRRRTSEVHESTSYHGCCAEYAAVSSTPPRVAEHSSRCAPGGVMRFAVRCACCSASELLVMCQQFPHCRLPRRRTGAVPSSGADQRCRSCGGADQRGRSAGPNSGGADRRRCRTAVSFCGDADPRGRSVVPNQRRRSVVVPTSGADQWRRKRYVSVAL